MLNLWAWEVGHTRHLGVSTGPDASMVLDLATVDPCFGSIAMLWQRYPDRVQLQMFLNRCLAEHSQRVALDMSTIRVPVSLSECWAAGVTYEISREARVEETRGAEAFYRRVYESERPELFFKAKAPGRRVVGHGAAVGLRRDSTWQVPEPELTLIVDPAGRLFGFTVGNDMSSRDIEGENPLYLPQAKIFHHSAAIGPCIRLADSSDVDGWDITMEVRRAGEAIFSGQISTSQMKRTPDELLSYLVRQWPVDGWTALMTGTALVPPASFALQNEDVIDISITGIGTLANVARMIGPDWVPLVGSAN